MAMLAGVGREPWSRTEMMAVFRQNWRWSAWHPSVSFALQMYPRYISMWPA